MNTDDTNPERDDELLTLYYYEDGLAPAERRAVAERLERDAAFGARYDALRAALDGIALVDSYETTADRRARFGATIDALADREARGRHARPRIAGWWVTAGVAASLVIGIAIGINLGTNGPETPAIVNAPALDEAPLVRRVTSHLRDSQQRLLAVDEFEQERLLLLRDIVTRNRTFIQKAEAQGDERLARVLRALEPVLIELAAEDALPEEREALASQLLFELNVVLTKYGQDTSKDATRT